MLTYCASWCGTSGYDLAIFLHLKSLQRRKMKPICNFIKGFPLTSRLKEIKPQKRTNISSKDNHFSEGNLREEGEFCFLYYMLMSTLLKDTINE